MWNSQQKEGVPDLQVYALQNHVAHPLKQPPSPMRAEPSGCAYMTRNRCLLLIYEQITVANLNPCPWGHTRAVTANMPPYGGFLF